VIPGYETAFAEKQDAAKEHARLVDAADDQELADLEDALNELDRRIELALIDASRCGVADDHLRVLCFAVGVEMKRIRK
jgi:hypothetical protein